MTLAPGEIGWFGYEAGVDLGPWPMTLGDLTLDQVDEFGSPWNVTEFTGKGSPPAEVQANQREHAHGAWVGNALWAAKPYSITGSYEAGTPQERWAAEQRLLSAVRLGTTTTTLVFHEETERQTEVVLSGEITIDAAGQDGFDFVIPLLAPDPFRYSITEHSVSATVNPGNLTLPNAGTETAYPMFSITAGATAQADVTLTRTDTGQTLTVDNPAGNTLTSGQTLTIDTRRRRILIGGGLYGLGLYGSGLFGIGGATLVSRRSWMSGEWLALPPGVTTHVTATSTTSGSGPTITATYRDVYV